MKNDKSNRKASLLNEWEEALNIEMPNLGGEMAKLFNEFKELMSGENASILSHALNLPLELLDSLSRHRKK